MHWIAKKAGVLLAIGIVTALLFALLNLLSSCNIISILLGNMESQHELTVNNDEGIASSPMDLQLKASSSPQENSVELIIKIGKREGYPPEKFEAVGIHVNVQLPRESILELGDLEWGGDLIGEEYKELGLVVKLPDVGDYEILASARTDAFPGFIFVADEEVLFVRVTNDDVILSDKPFEPPKEGSPTKN